MAAKQSSVKLSEQWQDGQFKCFRKMIGGKPFCFTQDRQQSERIAMALTAAWSQIRASGGEWSQDVIDNAMRVAGVVNLQSEARHGKAQARKVAKIYASIGEYLVDHKAKVSIWRYQRACSALETYKRYQPDGPIAMVDWDVLNSTVNHYRSRPNCHNSTRPMALDTVKEMMKCIRQFYDWCDVSGRWEAPRRFDRLFKIHYAALRTSLETKLDGLGVETFTVADLKSLWARASNRQRLYMGLAMNTGETAAGLAGLLKADLRQEGDTWVIDRHRGKTGVRGVYPLWSQVAKLVIAEMDKKPSEPLLFKSSDGKPLVWLNDTWRVDSVGKTWKKLLDKCDGVHPLPFKFLRKTGASIIESLTGSDRIAEAYLSHAGNSVAKRHYLARDYSKLAEALLQMHQHLTPVFEVEVAAVAA